MAQAFLVQKSGGGGVNQTLPEQVTAFHAAANSTPAVTLTWTNPADHFAGVVIVKKIGTAPTSPTDGEKIYSGTAETFTDADVQFDTEYFYRAFAYNEKKQYQTLYAVASAKPVSGIALSELAEGTLIAINRAGVATNHYLGKHDYEPELNGYGRQLMVSEECYDKRVWDSTTKKNAYATADIDTWQNSDYKALFSEVVQTMMGETTFYYTVGNGDYILTTLKRSIFLLSVTEYGFVDISSANTVDISSANTEGEPLPIANNLRIAYYNGSAIYHWTRTPHDGNVNRVFFLFGDGTLNSGGLNITRYYGSRPCFTLPANALVYPEPNADGSYTLIEEVA